jgi:hypothetical protein
MAECDDCKQAQRPVTQEQLDRARRVGCSELYLDICTDAFCAKCQQEKLCSLCEKGLKELSGEESESITMEISEYDGKPVCSICKETQCYKCGDEGGYETTWHGKQICEECGFNWCNRCGDYEGGCDDRCPHCDAPCDADCECMIDCENCGEEFTYDPQISRLRRFGYSKTELEFPSCIDQKQICPECWGDADEGASKD